MSIRWVISPVVEVGGSRRPKVSGIADPGRPYDVRTWDVYGALQADFSDEVIIEKAVVSLPTATEADVLEDYTSDDYPYLYFKAEDLGVSTAYKTYGHSSAIETLDWCLCFVRGVDMSGLDADPEIIDVLETDYEDIDGFLAATPNDLNWSPGKLNRVKNRLESKGVDFTGLTKDDPLWMWIQRAGEYVTPGFTPKGTWVK